MLLYKTMDTKTIVYCVVALILGMLMANMLKNVCGCKTVEGLVGSRCTGTATMGKDKGKQCEDVYDKFVKTVGLGCGYADKWCGDVGCTLNTSVKCKAPAPPSCVTERLPCGFDAKGKKCCRGLSCDYASSPDPSTPSGWICAQ
jgi:hypothetical protein